jgi:glycosyltransferase involved in cell wall biosynthesis
MSHTLLSHEWLAPVGGSENVFEQLIDVYPGAELACLWNDAPERFGQHIQETWLARSALRRSKAVSLPFMRSAWNKLDLSGYDRVICSSHALGHHLAGRAVDEGIPAYAYVHSPARYIWTPQYDHRGQSWPVRTAARPLRRLDRRGVDDRVDYAANSNFVRARIRSSWGQEARVIYPPIEVTHLQSVTSWWDHLDSDDAEVAQALPAQFVLGASRLVEYKRLDLVMQTGEELGLPVVIAGSGPDEQRLKTLASACKVPVHFVGRVSDELLYWLYSTASLFVFLAIEDFGIMPVEAMALGTPVLVNSLGGARESVELLSGGSTIDVTQVGELKSRAEEALSADMEVAMRRSTLLSSERFKREVKAWSSGAAYFPA